MKPWYIITLFFFFLSLYAQATVELKELLCHDMRSTEPTLELAKIVLLFSGPPQYKLETKRESDQQHSISFVFQAIVLSQAALDALERFNKMNFKYCKILFIPPTSSVKSGRLTIFYDPQLVVYDYSNFDSIKLDKGFICTLYNKTLLNSLSARPTSVLKRAAWDKKPGVVIDIGHGGKDSGTRSAQAILEKDITLSIGMLVADLLRAEGFQVFCTRSEDVFVPLDVRTSYGNQCKQADIVVSLHANSGTVTASGMETFCCTPLPVIGHTVQGSLAIPIQEQVSQQYRQSLLLAHIIQNATRESAKKKHPSLINRGVKQGVSQVLLGSNKPSVLVELGFLSHPLESRLLALADYQQLLARGIKDGICSYFMMYRQSLCS